MLRAASSLPPLPGALRAHSLAAAAAVASAAVAAPAPPRAPRRALHASAPAPALLSGRFFRGAFGRKRAETGGFPMPSPLGGPRLTLFAQDALPAELRLPRPADPIARGAAGTLDAVLALAGGWAAAKGLALGAAAAAAAPALAAALPEVAAAAAALTPADAAAVGQGAALLLWAFRDALGDGGSRSLGKRAFGLELTTWDGALPSRGVAAVRSWY
jgi:hypothetical protein